MHRSCILVIMVAMMITCCSAMDPKMKTQNMVQTDSVPVNDRNGYRFLRSYKTEEAGDATDNEDRALDLKSLKSFVRIKKTPNDFSKKYLEQMMINPKFKKEMIEKWGKSYTQEKVISKLEKKDSAMLLDFLNGNTALRPLIKVERPQNLGT
ncbi:hypothetical protein PRIC2_012575 [Phytophthora ramorum]